MKLFGLADNLTYHYLVDGSGNLLRNRLYHVNDAIAGAAYTGDLEDQGDFNFEDINGYNEYIVENNNNYRYDEEGRLIQDLAEGIENIVWRVDGKVKKVIFTSASGKNNLEFDYDAFGRRIAKHVLTQGNVLVKSTYYILDAQGNQLSTYEHVLEEEESNYELAERVIYGSSRLGINVNKVDLFGNSEEDYLNLTLGNKLFEMSNHLGNVLTVINDIKVPYLDGSDVAYYATIVSTSDYSPFGVQLDGRTVSASSYRFGFQGQEKDDEIKGAGNSVNYTFRMHDPRLARFFAVDPLADDFPWNSPYAFSENRVIDGIELEGGERLDVVTMSQPNSDTPGTAKITISMDYIVVTQGAGAVTKELDANKFRNTYAQGNGRFFMSSLPTPEQEGEFLIGKYARWASKASKGKNKFQNKLQKAGVTYYEVDVTYNYNLIIIDDIDICHAISWMNEDPHGRGVIAEPITSDSPRPDDTAISGSQYQEFWMMNSLARQTFRNPLIGGISSSEGAEDLVNSGIRPEANYVFLNPNTTGQFGGMTNVAIHEAGHNAAANHIHNTGNYEYNQNGLQSNTNPTPSRRNTAEIINDSTNRSTIKQ